MSLSAQMQAVLDAIRIRGGFAVPAGGGGFWNDAHGIRLDFANMTRTVYALEQRGLLVRRRFRKEPWRDTYAAAPEVMS